VAQPALLDLLNLWHLLDLPDRLVQHFPGHLNPAGLLAQVAPPVNQAIDREFR
jgi:hypothetical protein